MSGLASINGILVSILTDLFISCLNIVVEPFPEVNHTSFGDLSVNIKNDELIIVSEL
jgi:hypothetical protein